MENLFEKECNFFMKWIIQRKKFEEMKAGSYCQSDTFKAPLPGVTYCLRLYTNEDGDTYVYLRLSKAMMDSVLCDFTASIKSTLYAFSLTVDFVKLISNWGAKIAIKKELLNPLHFVDDKLTIEIDGTMKGSELRFNEKRYPFIQMMFERSDKDVTIFSGNEEIKAHKDILINRSSVFKKMSKNHINTLTFDGFSVHVVKNFIAFCYDKDIRNQITPYNAIEFFRFSDKFEMEDLKDYIEISLIRQISDENVCQFANISVEFNAKQLRECCISFLLLKSSDEIQSIKNWDKMDKEVCQEIIHRLLNFVSKNSFDVC